MSEIENIASAHLGRASDGSLVKPYTTPDAIDASLLVAIPRQLNRNQYNIKPDMLPFVGFDAWNCYEVSALCDNGYPANYVVKITYPSDNEFIVESKSLKLYLNSFNMHRLGDEVSTVSVAIKNKIREDLGNLLKTSVNVSIFYAADNHYKFSFPAFEGFDHLEDNVDYPSMQFDAYHEDPAILKINEIKETKPFSYFSTTLRSNCRVTNQPDWGDVFIYMDSNLYPTKESLLQYIVSMRKENHFHEEICECIYKRLWDIFDPRELLVACMYTRRGGIDINPVRASNYELLIGKAKNLLNKDVIVQKTMRQ